MKGTRASGLGVQLFALSLATAAWAQSPSVRFQMTAPTDSISLDQTIEVTVSLQRAGAQAFESYRAPVAPDFDLLHAGSNEQVQMSMVNGQQSVQLLEQHVYVYRPKRRGKLTIQPAAARVAGVELKTQALAIHVGAAAKGSASLSAPAAPAPEGLSEGDDLFVDAALDRPKVYVGQQVTASWRLYTRSEILKYRPLTEPKFEDFWSEDLFVPATHLGWDRAVIKGQEYAVALLLKKALFPLKAGKLTITPLVAEATTLQTAFLADASDTRRSRALTVQVLPLPAAGRPAGFESVNVGRFTLTAAVDRAAIKAGEAVTWKLTVRGVGNIRNVRLPKIEHLDGFRVYEPTTKETLEPGEEVRGQRVYTYLLLPQKGGSLTLPAVSLAYFDPEAGRYEVARSQPISLKVEGDPSKVQATTPLSSTENVLSEQIRPIRNRNTVSSGIGDRLFRGRLAIVLLALPPGAWLLVLIGDGLRRRLARETAGSKRRRAQRSARRRLRVAEYNIKAQRPGAFFGECARVLYEHLEYRLGAKVEGLTLAELRDHLVARGFEREAAEAVVQELENCDFARFAPSASGPGEMRAALRRVRALLSEIERQRPLEREAA